jgi:hypothetical protein
MVRDPCSVKLGLDHGLALFLFADQLSSFFLCAAKTFADSKYVPVRVPHVHLADIPPHVSGRKSDLPPGSQALSVNLVNVVHADRHPRAFVGRFIAVWSKRGAVCPSATAPLAWQRKISHSPEPTALKVGGFPQSQHFLHPHFLNHVKLAVMSDAFNIGVMAFAFMLRSVARHLEKLEKGFRTTLS